MIPSKITETIIENTKCLYCGDQLKITSTSDNFYIKSIYKCTNCDEIFISISDYEDGFISTFSFTCKNYSLLYNIVNIYICKRIDEYVTDKFIISKIMEFDVDFSDKEKLYKKLKNYAIFV